MEPEGPGNDNYTRVLTELGLNKHYPNKITFPEAIKVGTCPDKLQTSDLPLNLIRMLMRLDYRARDSSLVCEDGDGDGENVQLSPLDVLLATFTCCDRILQQSLSKNLFLCKLAIPFLYPVSSRGDLVLSLWALREIIVQTNEAGSLKETSVTDVPFHVVTFVRLGTPTVTKSKSELLNGILTGGTREIFYSYMGLAATTKERQIANGMLECAWFLPPSKKTDSQTYYLNLPGVTLFLNLRGDGLTHQRQMNFASKISSLIVIMADEEDLTKEQYADVFETTCKHAKKVLLLQTNTSDEKNKEKDMEKKQAKLALIIDQASARIKVKKNMKDITVRVDLAKKICTLLAEDAQSSKVSLKNAAKFCKEDGIRVDEQHPPCQEGKSLAEKTVNQIVEEYTERKRNLLPLQEKTWQEYGDLLRQQHREGSEEAKKKMMELRKKQAQMCNLEPTSFLGTFLSALVGADSDEVRMYFAQWMKLMLDQDSRRHLPGFRQKHLDILKKCEQAKQPLDQGQYVLKKISQAKQSLGLGQHYSDRLKAERDIASAFGLEHVLRELGHIYEVIHKKHASADQELSNELKQLPKAVAKLLIGGIPLELVDGDATTVPVTWLDAVLSELETITGKGNLFTISVLGVQSSGKSTLLNALFGLNFAVSAGRCTRGAFMQVIEVDRPDLPVKYIAVIDTEGLRAPELAQLKHTHDNEFATLVIGLADISLINIKGESAAEIKDVLQEVVHALMRMKIVNKNISIERSCFFIHQNVAALDAETQLGQSRQKLIEQLDSATKYAANKESVIDIHFFSQIIRYDINKHFQYFPDLWQGTPPMSRVNSEYNESAKHVKNCLFEELTLQTSFSTVKKFQIHIRDIWRGVLAENFILSYHNSLDVEAYHAMDKKYRGLQWELEKSLTSWIEKTAAIEIKNCRTVDELAKVLNSLGKDLETKIDEGKDKIKNSLTMFFGTHELKEILIQWRQQRLDAVETYCVNCRDKKWNHIRIAEQKQREFLKAREKMEKFEEELMKHASQLAFRLKEKEFKKPSEFKLQKEFDRMWKVAKLAESEQQHRNAEETKVENIIRTVLEELFHSDSKLGNELERQNLSKPLQHSSLAGSITLADVDESDIRMAMAITDSANRKLVAEVPVEQAQQEAFSVTSEILVKLDNTLSELGNQEFQKSQANRVIRMLKDDLDEFNQENTKTFSLKPTYAVKLAVHVGRHCVQVFTKMQNDYEEKYGVTAEVKRFKQRAFKVFCLSVEQNAEEAIAAELFCHRLKGIVETNLKLPKNDHVESQIKEEMNVKKHDFVVHMLRSLAEKDDFDNILKYIKNPYSFALLWMKTYINDRMFFIKQSLELEISTREELVERFSTTIELSVSASTEKVKEEREDKIGVWISTFCQMTCEELPVSDTNFQDLMKKKIDDFSNFTRLVLQELESMQLVLLKDLRQSYKDAKSMGVPIQEIVDSIWGCKAQCPFCGEPCIHPSADHVNDRMNHECLQHRPEGISGRHHRAFFWGFFGGDLATETCNNLVVSESRFDEKVILRFFSAATKYKDYKDVHKEWHIQGDPSNTVSKYWAWFMATYKDKLAERFKAKVPKIPEEWTRITKEEALADLGFLKCFS